MTKTYQLGPGVSAQIHPRIGRDHLFCLSVLAKLGKAREELPGLGFDIYGERFGFIVAQTESLEGLDFVLPSPGASSEEIVEAFNRWLALPSKVFERWIDAVEDDQMLNAEALLPKVSAVQREDPLLESSASGSEKKSISS